jgi:hypothetical protein
LGPFLPFNVVWLDQLLLGAMLILVQLYKPEGLIHEKPTPTLGKDKLMALIAYKQSLGFKDAGDGSR